MENDTHDCMFGLKLPYPTLYAIRWTLCTTCFCLTVLLKDLYVATNIQELLFSYAGFSVLSLFRKAGNIIRPKRTSCLVKVTCPPEIRVGRSEITFFHLNFFGCCC